MMNVNLLSPVRVGGLELPNRMVMSPMIRQRAGIGSAPGPMNALYYAQRASAGLIITEAAQISKQGIGYPFTPGIHTPEQVAGWRAVAEAVHARRGRLFLQLFHAGRLSHPATQGGALPVAPSAIKVEGEILTYDGLRPLVVPRALETEEIADVVEQFRRGAENALAAEVDGVEINSAEGYLLDQFLEDEANRREDRYGGSIGNRVRLLLEVTEAVAGVWGADRVGICLSPGGTAGGIHDSDAARTFGYAAHALNSFDLAYLHVIEPIDAGAFKVNGTPTPATRHLRSIFKNITIMAECFDFSAANDVVAAGDADAIGFGKLFAANPDLPERFAVNAPLSPLDASTFYGRAEKGYTDYQALDQRANKAKRLRGDL